MSAYRICFVCTGNICRSPSAEVILRARAEDAGLDVVVDSAGTDSYHVGDPADQRALRAMKTAGYDGSAHLARQFDEDWFAERDLVVALDRGHLRILYSLAPDDEAAAKIRMFRSFDPELEDLDEDDPRLDVADPYYGDDAGFTTMIEELEAAADGLVDFLLERTEHPA
ncbi:low molecular weight phosphotyrosine protein phosphatase [Kineosporia rhizophila]|uniref:low molecular weight protein-tyrosine-phosphatase n=1 Tax=Kineosporia TaxID=49184 RepID=UPI001E4D13FF|nr:MULTISPECIES: low molecular weight protein-tyrosine-phosphatase [Kineosporia]MCE0535173.1 low molecular weight phosphotyrosine protein phosphatase [Kineosporia rhizophila]GLY14540.1 low molecular weight protein-tyrosine-phosphatase [Kineosporia sp. NBRC 101677]